jgi:hypothetical protein
MGSRHEETILELEVSQCVCVAFGELAFVDGRSPCLCFWSSGRKHMSFYCELQCQL